MTAINVAMLSGETHLFTDGGHYEPDSLVLRAIGGKVLHLPRLPAVLAYSGPSRGAYALLREIVRDRPQSLSMALCGLADAVRRANEKEGIDGRFSAFLLGAGRGMTIEEGNRVAHLHPGMVIKSLPSPVQFYPDRIAASGLAMMIDQRARHRVVSGFCEQTIIRPGGIGSRILHRWSDVPVPGSGETVAAKIANLTVDTINVAPGAVTGVASASGSNIGTISVTSPNPFNYPIKAIGSANISYQGTASSSSGTVTLKISRGGTVLYQETWSFSGNNTQTATVNAAFLDVITGSQTYSLQTSTTFSGTGALNVGATKITALYTQK